MKKTRTYSLPDKPRIEHFGELLLWDERIERFLREFKGVGKEESLKEHLGFIPNVYAIYSATSRGIKLGFISFSYLEVVKGYNHSTVAVICTPKGRDFPLEVLQPLSDTIIRHLKKKIIAIVEDVASFASGSRRKLPYTASVLTIETLMYEQNRA